MARLQPIFIPSIAEQHDGGKSSLEGAQLPLSHKTLKKAASEEMRSGKNGMIGASPRKLKTIAIFRVHLPPVAKAH
jgi:hypothetical protein